MVSLSSLPTCLATCRFFDFSRVASSSPSEMVCDGQVEAPHLLWVFETAVPQERALKPHAVRDLDACVQQVLCPPKPAQPFMPFGNLF